MSDQGEKVPAKKPRKRAPGKPSTKKDAGTSKTPAKQSRARKQATRKPASTSHDDTMSQAPMQLIRVAMPVRWRDLDAFNHVNNSQYLSYLEEARLQWLMTLPGDWIDDNVAPVVAAAHINYRRPIEWPNEISIELFIERLGDTSLTIGHRIVSARSADILYADGNVVMVWIDRHRGEAAALPEAVRTACTNG